MLELIGSPATLVNDELVGRLLFFAIGSRICLIRKESLVVDLISKGQQIQMAHLFLPLKIIGKGISKGKAHAFRWFSEVFLCLREQPAASRYRVIGVHSARPRSLRSAWGGPPIWRKRMANISRSIIGVRRRSSNPARVQIR
jgi:hypothetical protein